jgi:hypothetical protein
MVTHPAYWRRGHASATTKWCLGLSELDHIGVGVVGAPMRKIFFSSLGFKESSTVEIPGYPEHPGSVFARLELRKDRLCVRSEGKVDPPSRSIRPPA